MQGMVTNIRKKSICGSTGVKMVKFWCLLTWAKSAPASSLYKPYLRTGEGDIAFWESLGSLGGRGDPKFAENVLVRKILVGNRKKCPKNAPKNCLFFWPKGTKTKLFWGSKYVKRCVLGMSSGGRKKFSLLQRIRKKNSRNVRFSDQLSYKGERVTLGDLGHTKNGLRGRISPPKFFSHDSNFWDDFSTKFQDSKSKDSKLWYFDPINWDIFPKTPNMQYWLGHLGH